MVLDNRFTLDPELMCGQSAIMGGQEYLCHVKKGMHKVDKSTNIVSHGGFASHNDAVDRNRPAAWSNYEHGPDND